MLFILDRVDLACFLFFCVTTITVTRVRRCARFACGVLLAQTCFQFVSIPLREGRARSLRGAGKWAWLEGQFLE